MQGIILDLLGELVLFVLLFFMAKAWKWAKPFMENLIIRTIVADGIKYAQKVYGHLNGHVRLQAAYVAISRRLERWDIQLTAEEIRVFIESILLELQAHYQDKWWELPSVPFKLVDETKT